MEVRRDEFTRRHFVTGLATAVGALGLPRDLFADRITPRLRELQQQQQTPDWDSFAKLHNNENCWGPPESVLKAMTGALKYSNRYGVPDSGLTQELVNLHGVKRECILYGAGSGEILDVVGATFLQGGKKVVGAEPTYGSVYSFATGIKADAVRVPLLADHRLDVPGMIKATKANYRDVGFVYLCNPNNPTARIVTRQEVKQLLDGIPEDIPVLIDEAYHHYVEDPAYATSIPYVNEGRRVIVARTFSKIAGLAGMRLGYAVAPQDLVNRMRNHGTGTINAVVRFGGAASIKDTESQASVKRMTLELRKKTTGELEGMGYMVIPSDANFFMVGIKREVRPVIDEFRKKLVQVGRPFPPMNDYLRVSVGTADEMGRFMKAWKEIFTTKSATVGAGS